MLYIKLFIEREKIQVNLRRSVPLKGKCMNSRVNIHSDNLYSP